MYVAAERVVESLENHNRNKKVVLLLLQLLEIEIGKVASGCKGTAEQSLCHLMVECDCEGQTTDSIAKGSEC